MTPWLLLGLTFALDSGSALRYPAYQTTIVDILPRPQIASALVLASVGWNIARAAGPGIGGLIIAVFGVPAAFAVNALCNVLIVVVLMPLAAAEHDRQGEALGRAPERDPRRLPPCPCRAGDPLGDAALLPVHAVRQCAVVAAAAGRQAAGRHRRRATA